MTSRQQEKLKEKFIELLGEHPIVSSVCTKLNVSRATYYRWKDEDPSFKILVERAMDRGRDNINDRAEQNVIRAINNGDPGLTKYWLGHNHPKYMKIKPEDPQFVPATKTEDTGESLEDLVSIIGEILNRGKAGKDKEDNSCKSDDLFESNI